MKFTPVECPICGHKKNFTVLYPKNFRVSDFNRYIFSARRLPDTIHYRLVKCNSCGLVRSTPTIKSTELYDLYKKSRLTYDKEVENLVVTYLNAVKPILRKLSYSAKILEIGCGSGFLLKAIHDLGYKNVYGIEPSTDAVYKAHKSLKRNLKHGVMKSGIFKRNTFDLIFFFQTLDHIPNPNAFLEDCLSVLKKNGYILAFNHNVDSLFVKLLGEKNPIFDIEHTFLYSPKTIQLLFEKHGYRVNTVYSPSNLVSLRHIMCLSPIPKKLKNIILTNKSTLLDININMQLGNLCLVARKI